MVKRPFLKWAGGKTRLIGSIRTLLPPAAVRFIEPFVGSGAVFLNTDYPANLLADSNRDLIGLFALLKSHGAEFAQVCQSLFVPETNTKEAFYPLREEFNATADPERRAALFVYLNRHCFNGLCRYNARGKFNVPFGRHAAPSFPAAAMAAFAARLSTATIANQDFRVTMTGAQPGDVVYCDPPYVPLSPTARFTDYAAGGFTERDQRDLAALCREAAVRGATVLVSNHDTPFTRELYSQASQIVAVSVSRSISCDGGTRGKAKEMLALFWPKER